MATFSVAAGTDWIDTMVFGSDGERWRLDDYDLFIRLIRPGDPATVLDLAEDDGRLVVSDPVARRLEINVGWAVMEPLVAPLMVGQFEFDVLLENKTTGVRTRSGPHTLSITRGITFKEA